MTRSPLLLLLATLGCLPAAPSLDRDGDGWPWPEDCADDNASIHPEAEELAYDGVDQDCDGASDFDKDGDGFDGVAYGGTDCNDSDPGVYPGATEVWYDGMDQDCSGGSDYDQDGDGGEATSHGGTDCDDTDPGVYGGAEEVWYDGLDQDCDARSDFDQDRDGYDCLAEVSEGCPPTSVGDDCDDTIPAIHPDARETLNEVDEDCDGDVDEVPWGSEDPTYVGALHRGLLGEGIRFYGLGYAISGTAEDVASTADILESTLLVDQDGAPDLLVSAPLGRFFGGEYGFFGQAVYLVAGGSPADMSGDSVATRTVLRLESDRGLTEFGAQVAWVTSVDGDAIPEILVGAPAEEVEAAEGLAYLFRSSDWDQAPLATTPEGEQIHVLDAVDSALAIHGVAGDGFGVAASLGDWRGMGLGGVAVAASRAGAWLDAEVWVEPGKVYLFGSDLLGDTNRVSVGTDEAALVITGGREQQHVGAAAPVLGDLDGDGLADLVVSSTEAAEGAGALAALLAGGSDISGEIDFLDMDLVLAASGSLTGLGQRLAAGGDLDGDGYGDVAAMATTASAHVFIEVVSGGRWGPPDAQDLAEVLLVEIDGVGLATGLDTVAFDLAADFNGDWYSDLAVGSAEGEPVSGGGLVAVLYGMPGLAGSVNVQGLDARIVGATSEWFGYTSLAGLDITADGLPELVVGAPGYDALASEHLRAGALDLLDPLLAW